jgi:lipopolysaccharide transport system ATP-binding protein
MENKLISDPVIKVETLGKKYIIGHQRQKHDATLRESIANSSRSLVGQLRGKSLVGPSGH